MTVPVVHSLTHTYRDVRVTVVSRPFAAPLFSGISDNVNFKGVDVKHNYKGICGMRRLAGELRHAGVTHVADLHDVLRTKVLRTFLRLSGCRVSVFDKGKRGKRRLIKLGPKRTAALPHTVERYHEAFVRFGLDFPLRFDRLPDTGCSFPEDDVPWLGLAPFAAHAPKTYPQEMLCKAVELVRAQRPDVRIFVFSSRSEARKLQTQAPKALHQAVYCALSCDGLQDELAVMSHLSCLVSMDSGNAHLAALTGTRVITLWGGTHPYAGFSAWRQPPELSLQADLPCRPCSVFGKKDCRFGDLRCMKAIPPETVARTILQNLRT